MDWKMWSNLDTRYNGTWKSEDFTIGDATTAIHLILGTQKGAACPIWINFTATDTVVPAVKAVERDDALYICHNDSEHLAEYTLRLDGDTMKCDFSVTDCFGFVGTFTHALTFTRTTDDECAELLKGKKWAAASFDYSFVNEKYVEYARLATTVAKTVAIAFVCVAAVKLFGKSHKRRR